MINNMTDDPQAPWGGFKYSGIGREYGRYGIEAGATGMVGGYALRYALENAAVGTVTAIVRRKLGISHPKLQEVLHRDFGHCSPLLRVLSGQDAAVFCLGAYDMLVRQARSLR